jgi:hypothetical protein
VGKRNFSLSPQSQFRNLKKAPPQSQFRNFWRNVVPQPQLRNSAIAIFSEVRNFKSATWELQFRNFRHIFGRGNWSIHGEKNQRSKLLCYCPFKASFRFPEKQRILKIFFFLLLKPSWAEEKGQERSGLAGDCGKLRNCGSQILKVRNHSSATFFSPQLRNRFGCPQYCGVAEVRT